MKLLVPVLLLQGVFASFLEFLRPGHAQHPLDTALSESTGDSFPVTTIKADGAKSPTEFSHSALLSLHRDLVALPSITGNESGVGEYLIQALHDLHFTIEKQHVTADRFNVYAYRGTNRTAPRVLASSHIDTVPPYYPYERSGDRISGRGSADAKASVAAQIGAVIALLARDEVSDKDVGLLFVVGEEVSGDGMRAANDLGLAPETVIFGEPTELALACGHKGILQFRIQADGKAAHSGYPWLGVSANELMLAALVRLQAIELPETDKYGNTTLNIGRIDGGVAGNVVPEKALAEVTLRLAGGDPKQLKRDIEQTVIGDFEKTGKDGTMSIEWLGNEYAPVDIDCDVDGFDTTTVNYGTDIPNFHLSPSQTRYLYGPGSILVAHSDHEHLFGKDLFDAMEGYERLILKSLE